MRRALLCAAVLGAAGQALAAERVTTGGELICFKRDDLVKFVALLKERGPSVAQSVPGCIAAKAGLVLTSRGSAGEIAGAGPVTQVRAVSRERGKSFDAFTTARF